MTTCGGRCAACVTGWPGAQDAGRSADAWDGAVGMDSEPRQRSEGLSGVGRGSLGLPSSRRGWDGTASSATGPDVPLRPKPGLSDAPSLQVLEHLQPPGRLFQGLPRACVVAAVPTVVPTGPGAG